MESRFFDVMLVLKLQGFEALGPGILQFSFRDPTNCAA
jgi:hypothetical protein